MRPMLEHMRVVGTRRLSPIVDPMPACTNQYAVTRYHRTTNFQTCTRSDLRT
jgi:hypothetical protein